MLCVDIQQYEGCAIAQVVRRRLNTVEDWNQFQVRPCAICCGKSVFVTGFLRVLRFSHASIIPPMLINSSITNAVYSQQLTVSLINNNFSRVCTIADRITDCDIAI